MKKLRVIFPVLLAVLMIAWLRGQLLAADKIAELIVPRQRVNLDSALNDIWGWTDPNISREFEVEKVELYADGTADGQGSLADRTIEFEYGRMSPGQFGPDISFDVLYESANSADPGSLTFERNARGEINVIMALENKGAQEFKITSTIFTNNTNVCSC